MKKIWLLIAVISICGMCSKEDKGGEPPAIAIKLSKGFLTTIGINGIGKTDSICFRNSSSGTSYTLTDYTHTSVAGNFLQRPKDIWDLSNSGTNTWHLKNSGGRYLGIGTKVPNIQANEYHLSLDEVPGEKNLFVMNELDGQFYIQPVSQKNVYLNTMAANVQPPDRRHSQIRFIENNKQLWFFMP